MSEAVDIGGLIPHSGAMCLLDSVVRWSAEGIECRATSHLDPGNPLRRDGRLAAVCGIEYGLQAAAVHGALVGGARQPLGFVVSLRMSRMTQQPLDDPALGTLTATARRERGDGTGLLYVIGLAAADGRVLLEGRAAIKLTRT